MQDTDNAGIILATAKLDFIEQDVDSLYEQLHELGVLQLHEDQLRFVKKYLVRGGIMALQVCSLYMDPRLNILRALAAPARPTS